ncbi:hypothetical protein GIB67_027825 [Kingdonia uniflora]|uniref:CCHC-type domain-containing protein n=1 Tax=Kingdonia uniflora TaxID=39325 RepID=A0A7J7MIB3_9MAGN|nr:hypothetical protein GIB67_027825 [Kingdonia uniflora]
MLRLGNDIEVLAKAISEQTHDVHLKVPEFTGKSDADAFIEWLDKVEHIFNYKKYLDPKQVMIIESRLTGFAITWWNNVQQAACIGLPSYFGMVENVERAEGEVYPHELRRVSQQASELNAQYRPPVLAATPAAQAIPTVTASRTFVLGNCYGCGKPGHQKRDCPAFAKKMGEVVKDVTAGTVGEAAQLMVGHPFDSLDLFDSHFLPCFHSNGFSPELKQLSHIPMGEVVKDVTAGTVGEAAQLMMGEVVKDLTAGTVGGAAQLMVGHPFDTIKVKLQSQPAPLPGQPPKFSGAMNAVKQTIAVEGVGGLYKGMGAPLATVAGLNAVLFTVRGQMEALLRSEPGTPLTISQQVLCGAGAGVAVSILACPTELIKCRLQAQSALADLSSAGGGVKYGGPMDVARHVLKSEGGARGLFKGLVPTLAREVPGNAAMFGVYEAIKQYLAGDKDTSKLGRGSLVVAGGLAGASFWISVYPTDVIKSVIQVDDYKNPKFSGSIDAFKKILASEGVKGLYKGFEPAMARSIAANAACFLAYEMTRSSLG